MATHRIPILGFSTVPDTSGNCWLEPMSVLATNDNWPALVARFGSDNAGQPSTRIGLHGRFDVPQNYVGSAAFVIVWSASVTSGSVEWDVDYRAISGDDSESLDQATAQESLNDADVAPSAAWERNVLSISATGSNFAAGDTVQFTLFRDGTDAGDTMAGSALLFDLLFQYADA